MKRITLKHLILVFGLTICCYEAQANTREGLYVGGGIATSADHFELTTKYLGTRAQFSDSAQHNNTLGNLFVGLGYTMGGSFFIGGELGTQFPSHSVSIINRPVLVYGSTVNDTLKIQDYLTMDLLPGYSIDSNFLVYGRLGLAYSSLKLKQPNTLILRGLSNTENVWGGRFGLGVNFAFNPNFAVGLDYYFTDYQNMNFYSTPYHSQLTSSVYSNFVGLSIIYTV